MISRQLLFPGYFGTDQPTRTSAPYFAGQMLHSIYERLYPQIRAALAYQEGARSRSVELRAEEAAAELMAELPRLQKLLLIDVEAALNGDPAAGSKEQIILSYPGLRAIFTYRIAHELYIRNIPYIPRIMTEHAHSRTGIDINSGATIGEYFFIDHGTGVVIGETTNIGNNVKIYQGVTLGRTVHPRRSQAGGQKAPSDHRGRRHDLFQRLRSGRQHDHRPRLDHRRLGIYHVLYSAVLPRQHENTGADRR